MQLSGLLKSYQPQMVSFSRPPLALALLPRSTRIPAWDRLTWSCQHPCFDLAQARTF